MSTLTHSIHSSNLPITHSEPSQPNIPNSNSFHTNTLTNTLSTLNTPTYTPNTPANTPANTDTGDIPADTTRAYKKRKLMDKTFNLTLQERHAKSLDTFSDLSDSMPVDEELESTTATHTREFPRGSDHSCPCGHLHGPNQGHHHDIHAVGLASEPLLRGPD